MMASTIVAEDDELLAVHEMREIIERCIAEDCVSEIPKKLKLWETTDYELNLCHQEKKSIKGDICFYWSEMLIRHTADSQVPLLLAREGIKCLLACYFDPPVWNTKRVALYLSRAILHIVNWGCIDLLPSKSDVKEGIQHVFNSLMQSLHFIDDECDLGERLLSFLLKRNPDHPNSGWLLDFNFSAANSHINLGVMLFKKLYDRDVVCTLLEHGMQVLDIDIYGCLEAVSDEEYIVFHELIKRVPKELLQNILIEKVISSGKFNFAAIIRVHRGDTDNFIKLACLPGVCLSNIRQLLEMLKPKDCSNLFSAFCRKRILDKCLMMLESGTIQPDALLIKQHQSFIFNTEKNVIFNEILKLNSSAGTINAFFETCMEISSKTMPVALKYRVALVLVKKGGNINLLNLAYTQGNNCKDTAIHGAVELCLKRGDCELLFTVCEMIKSQTPQASRKLTDSKKSTPYHLIMKFSINSQAAEICDVLSSFNFIDPASKDMNRRKPIYYAKGKFSKECMAAYDRAVAKWKGQNLCTVQETQKPTLKKSTPFPSLAVNKREDNTTLLQERIENNQTSSQNDSLESATFETVQTNNNEIKYSLELEELDIEDKSSVHDNKSEPGESDTEVNSKNSDDENQIANLSFDDLIKSLLNEKSEYFTVNSAPNQSADDEDELLSKNEMPQQVENTEEMQPITDDDDENLSECLQGPEARLRQNVENKQLVCDAEEIDLSSLPWEIFISKQAGDLIKASKTPKKVVLDIKKKLKRIGEGERSKAICHRLVLPECRLFETYLYRAARIIWCEDIQYSEQKSNPAEGQIVYCDVVKILWITLKHSKNQLNDVLQRIKLALAKSQQSVGKELNTLNHPQQSQCRKGYSYPRMFCPASMKNPEFKYHPLPNLYGGEFSVMQFHPFSEFVNAILNSDPSKRECSIGMSQQEHELIKLPYGKEPLIVCGRSGTGKTTTCIYRMWNEFRSSWEKLQTIESESENDSYDSNDDYLHQVFVTKSPVLCSQVKKEFDKLLVSCKADDFNRESLKMNSSFRDCGDNMFPLFLTSKKLLFILDASLPGEKFFLRDENKEFKVDFNFSDYDETKDPENLFLEVEEHKGNKTQSNSVKPAAIEVNADYFCNTFWNKLPDKFRLETIDPLLVWTEIHSFIKGSMEALESENGFINRNEYKALGRHAAPSFAGDEAKREMCFDIFEQYSKFLIELRKNCFIFDENDFVFNVYTRFKQLHKQDNPLEWHIDHFYIDEVQDFTQAELCLLLRICQNPYSTFCTGDIAQSIMKGVFFRFEDLKTQFFKLSATSEKKAKAPQLLSLTENFRSHSGVLNLGQAVVDILKRHFTHSFRDSNLPQEEAMFKGPEPILLQTSSKETLVRILLGSDSESSSPHELGAHQAILVRSDDARNSLPESLRGGIVLTVLEAKGLEFNDVLLYNFFSDSQVKDQWRFLYNIIKEQYDSEKMKEVKCKTGRLHFYNLEAEKQEERLKSLSADLKHLYTAITRARVNLWIYDEGKKCEPFFFFCLVKKLARLIDTNAALHDDDSLMFAAPSPAEQWCKQGDYYFSLGKWNIAMNCYEKGKSDHKYFLTQGYKLFEKAHNTQSKDTYKEAGCMLLCADKCKHSIEYIEKGVVCFQKADCHIEAAELLEKMEKFEKAADEWMIARHTDRAVKLREQLQQYSEVVRCYVRSGDYANAFLKAKEYEKSDVILQEDVKFEQLFSECEDKELKKKASEFVSGGSVLKATILIEAGKFEEAIDELIRIDHFDQANRIIIAKGLFRKGCDVVRDEEKRAMFLFYNATSLLVESEWSTTKEIDSMLTLLEKCPFRYIQARTQILLGIINKDGVLLKEAIENFKTYDCLPGAVFAFHSLKYLQTRSEPSDDLSNSKSAFEIAESIRTHPSQRVYKQNTVYREVLRVHDLETDIDDENKYFISPYLLKYNICSELCDLATSGDTIQDQDGMLILDKMEVNERLSSYYDKLSVRFLTINYSEYFTKQLPGKIKSSSAFAYLSGNRCENLLLENLDSFFKNLRDYIEYCSLIRQESSNILSDEVLLKLFSPSAAFNLSFTRRNVYILRDSKFAKEFLEKIAMNKLKDRESTIESYLVSFRILTRIVRAETAQQKLNEVIKSAPRGHQYVFEHTGRNGEKTHQHIFNGWLTMNHQIHKKSYDITNMFWPVYNYFLKRIAELSDDNKTQAMSIGSINYIVSVFSTALLTLLRPATFNSVPVLFPKITHEKVVNNFDIFNGRPILTICFDQLMKPLDPKKLIYQLKLLLSFLLGENPGGDNYNILHTALTTESCIKDGSAFFCLIQCLVLAGNMYCWSHKGFGVVEEAHAKLLSIQRILRASRNELVVSNDSHSQFVTQAIDQLSLARNTKDLFLLISKLLSDFHYTSELVTPQYFQIRLDFPLVYQAHYPNFRIKSLVVIEKPNDEVVELSTQESRTDDLELSFVPPEELESPSEELKSPILIGPEDESLLVAPQTVSAELIIDGYCKPCGKMLQKEGQGEEGDLQELRAAHLRSSDHENKVFHYNEYKKTKFNLEENCLMLTSSIATLLQENKLEKLNILKKQLNRLMNNIQSTDRDMMKSCDWMNGTSKLKEKLTEVNSHKKEFDKLKVYCDEKQKPANSKDDPEKSILPKVNEDLKLEKPRKNKK